MRCTDVLVPIVLPGREPVCFQLTLAHTEPGLVRLGRLVKAVVAAYAHLVFGALCVLGPDRAPAAMAQHMRTFLQPMSNADTVIKYKAIAMPGTLIHRYFFEIFQNAALKVENILDTLAQ